MLEQITGPLTVIGVACARSLGGWLESSLADSKINTFELKQLGQTIVRVSLETAAIFYGVSSLFGVQTSVLAASASAFIFDKIIGAIKDLKKTK